MILWQAIRGRRLGGARFRRQHPFGPYILAFHCNEARLAVEIDDSVYWPVVNVDKIDVALAHKESPNTNRFYRISDMLAAEGDDYEELRDTDRCGWPARTGSDWR